jgi:hypothetical protein
LTNTAVLPSLRMLPDKPRTFITYAQRIGS